MAIRQNLFGNLGNKLNNMPLSGNLGLLTAGVGLLEGQPIGQAVQAGLGVYGSLSEDEERRRRRAALSKLGEQYAGDPRLKAIIDADPEAGLSLIAQLEANKRAYRAPTTLQQRKNLAAALGYSPDSAEYRRILATGSDAAAPITTAKDADGFLRNVATGERIFPDATGKADKPILSNVGGTLYNVTDPTNPTVVVAAKDDPKTAMIGDKLYDITDLANPKVIVDETQATKPILSNVGGTLYNVTDPTNPTVVVAAKNDPKTANIGGSLYDISDINNPKLVIEAPKTPVTASTQNYVAQADFTLNGRTIKKGEVFAIDRNNPDDVTAALVDGQAIVAPTRTESTITNTPENVSAANEVLTGATEAAAEIAAADPAIDIVQAGGGDIGGKVTDVLNAAAGFFGTTFNATREEQKAAVNAANNAIREPLVKALSRSGSVYTQKQIAQLLPSPGDSNEKFIQKAEALIPTLQNEMKYQATVIATSKDASEKQAAQNSLQDLAKYTEGMRAAIRKYRQDRPSGGVSATQQAADKILSGSN